MGTSWAEIITNSAMLYIDDVRLQEDLAVDPAQFFRKMSLYMNRAIPLMNRPPELLNFLTVGLTQPVFGDSTWESTQESTTQETVVETGQIGFSLFSCVVSQTDSRGNVTFTPYTAARYDSGTGQVTFPVQAAAGTQYVLDFYTDGSFAQTLTLTQQSLLGQAIALTWDERFSRNWLNMQPKVHDNSFTTVNEGTYTEKTTARMKSNRAAFYDELRKYEQDCAFQNVVPYPQKTGGTLV